MHDYCKLDGSKANHVAQDLATLGMSNYHVEGKKVCLKCYMLVHNVTKYDVENARGIYHQKKAPGTSPKVQGARPAPKRESCKDFLRNWHRERSIITSRDGKPFIPFPPMCSMLYEEFTEEGGKCDRKWFREAFNEERKTWNYPRHKGELKACSRCYKLYALILKARRAQNSEEAERYIKELKEHKEYAYAERLKYCDDREASNHNPNVLCLIVDFTHPLFYPFIPQRTSWKDKFPKLPVGFGCILDHSPEKDGGGTYFALLYGCGGKDNANAVCSLLYDHLLVKQTYLE